MWLLLRQQHTWGTPTLHSSSDEGCEGMLKRCEETKLVINAVLAVCVVLYQVQ